MRRIMGLLTTGAALLLLAEPVAAQEQRGTIVGQVVEASTQRPLDGVQVLVIGTALGTVTNAEGRYRLANVPAGQREVRAVFIGYEAVNRPVTVAAGETATVDVQLVQAAVAIDAILVNVAGQEQRGREIGNVVAKINVAQDVNLANVSSFSQVLQSRSPGVTVLSSSGTSGGGSRVRIRGSNSVSLSNSPLLIVDGIRVQDDPQSFTLFTGGQTVSRLDDLNPEDIESVEILKGPSAAAMYGTAAANGVIQVTTKRGRVGVTTIRAFTETSRMNLDEYTWPDNFYATGAAGAGSLRRCALIDRISATGGPPVCPGGVTTLHRGTPLNDSGLTPFRDGTATRWGASIAGGGEAATYYVSGDLEKETGVQLGNDLNAWTLRANLTGRVRDNLQLGANVGYTDKLVQLPQNDNSAASPLLNGLRGNPHPIFTDSLYFGDGQPNPFYTGGFRPPLTFPMTQAWEQFQDVQRFTGGANANWIPLEWLQFNATAGLDLLNRWDNGIIAPNILTPFGSPFAEGLREQWRYNYFTYTALGAATAIRQLSDDVRSTTSAGVQYVGERFNLTVASAAGISPGSRQATQPLQADEDFSENRTFGAFAQQQLGWRDRIFVTGALRGDQNSAFGENLDFVWYPSVSASWVLSEEPFFPAIRALNNFRVRAAWGRSGLRPGVGDAQQAFAVASASVRNEVVPGFVIDNAGNSDLRPEVSTETEAGFDVNLFDNRLGLQFAYYHKKSTDALVSRPLAPSFGSAAARLENIGEVSNQGIELLVQGEPVRLRDAALDFTLSYATTKNELITLGEDIPPIVFDVQRHREGYPLGGYWLRPYTFSDLNSDGTISYNEVVLEDSAKYLGTPFPTRELSLTTNLRFRELVRVTAMLDHRGGHKLFNWTEFNRCVGGVACQAAHDPATPLAQQARIIASTALKGGTLGASGFLEEADFTKLREVSVTLFAPASVTRRIGFQAQGLSLTLAGRNLATWTDYSGFDPEVNSTAQSNFTTDDFYTLPPARRYTVRLDITF